MSRSHLKILLPGANREDASFSGDNLDSQVTIDDKKAVDENLKIGN